MTWFQTGPGSWQQQRPKLLALLEAMQQQGLYDPDAAAPAAAAAAADAPPQQQQQEGEDAGTGAEASSSSSSSGGAQAQAQVAGRPLGLLGLSWGSFIGLHAAGDEAVVAAGVKVLAALSPATYNRDYDITVKLALPVALLPAKYDVMDQVMMFINLLAKPWEMRCVFKRFGKVSDAPRGRGGRKEGEGEGGGTVTGCVRAVWCLSGCGSVCGRGAHTVCVCVLTEIGCI